MGSYTTDPDRSKPTSKPIRRVSKNYKNAVLTLNTEFLEHIANLIG